MVTRIEKYPLHPLHPLRGEDWERRTVLMDKRCHLCPVAVTQRHHLGQSSGVYVYHAAVRNPSPGLSVSPRYRHGIVTVSSRYRSIIITVS